MIASAAPANNNSPRHTVQNPAVSDHIIVPIAIAAPTPMKTQGFASYSVCGVQERIFLVYSLEARGDAFR